MSGVIYKYYNFTVLNCYFIVIDFKVIDMNGEKYR